VGDWAAGRPRLDGRYPVMLADELIELLISHPDAYLITDTKGDVVAVLEQLVALARRRDPDLVRRIIPQLYRPEDIDRVDAIANFERRMLTLYRMPDVSDEEITALVDRHRIGAVVMPPARARPDFVAALREVGALVYVHTLNRAGNIEAALARGVHGIYTDFDRSLLVEE
jgi:glycerophosphoryl diester phosphodiesterase